MRCSLAMGMSRKTLERRAGVLNTIATNLSLFLSAVRSVVPREFSASYTSPCWESPIPPLTAAQRRGLGLLSHTNLSSHAHLIHNLHRQILVSPREGERTTLRCLPAFFLAGFPKSGTTTLHRALYRHRTISQPAEKEPHWWTRVPLGNEDQDYLRLATVHYLLYFSDYSVRRDHNLLFYDGSQSLLWDSNFSVKNQDQCAMPVALSHILPAAKFVVVMRNPVSRTYSHYLYSCTWNGRKPAGPALFHLQVVSEIAHLNSCLSNSSLFECAGDARFKMSSSSCGSVGYRLLVSLYRLHLSKWLQLFPRDRFLLLRLEDLSKEPHLFMRRVTQFLGVSDLRPASTRWLHTHRENRQQKHRAMLPETRALLTEFFRPYNQALVELTGDKQFLWTDTH